MAKWSDFRTCKQGFKNRIGLSLKKKKVEGVQYREIYSKGIPAINLHSSFRISMDTQLTGLGPPYA